MRGWSIAVLGVASFTCAACAIGMSPPAGDIWQVVAASGPSGRPSIDSAGHARQTELARRLHAYLFAKLPLSPAAFVTYLKAQQFQCDAFGEHQVGGTDAPAPDTVPIGCWYFERGPIRDDGCNDGEAVAVELIFQGSPDVHDFSLREISFEDPTARGTGLCAVF